MFGDENKITNNTQGQAHPGPAIYKRPAQGRREGWV